MTTINFDRNKIRKMCADLSKKSDETSAALDAALVNTPVESEAPFDVNETFAEAFEAHMSALKLTKPLRVFAPTITDAAEEENVATGSVADEL